MREIQYKIHAIICKLRNKVDKEEGKGLTTNDFTDYYKQLVENGGEPSAHTHVIADVTGLQTALDSKSPTSHTHTITNVTNLQTTLDGKAPTSHTHTIANITNLQTTLDGKAPTTHTHTIANITNLQTTLDGKAPTAHTHSIANVTGLQDELDDIPQVRNENQVITSPKIFVTTVAPDSTGEFVVDFGAGVFTTPPRVFATTYTLNDSPTTDGDAGFASIYKSSITTTGCNGRVRQAESTDNGTSIINNPFGAEVQIMAIGN